MFQVLIPVLVDKIFDRLVKDPVTPVERTDAPVVKPEIRDVLKNELEPMLEHMTNTEPAVKSRVTQGAVGVIVIAAGTMLYSWSNGTLTGEVLYTQGSIIAGAVWTLYGRWKAKKPVQIVK